MKHSFEVIAFGTLNQRRTMPGRQFLQILWEYSIAAIFPAGRYNIAQLLKSDSRWSPLNFETGTRPDAEEKVGNTSQGSRGEGEEG